MLEILASVRACSDKPFVTLENLVIGHISAVSGCICVLQKWDDTRKEFVKKIRALDVPVLVFVVTPSGKKNFDLGPMRGEPDNFHVLEIGKIKEQLARLS
jgi:hypothetical protein